METNGKNKSYPTLNGHGDDSAGFVNVARTSPGAGGRFARKNTDIDFRKLLALLSTDRKGASELRILAEHIKVLLEKENYILGPNAVHAALVVMWEIEIGDCDVVLFRPDGSSLSMQNQTDASECFMVKDEEGLGIAMVVFDQGTYMQGLYRVVVRQRSDGQSSQNPKARAVLYDYAEPNRYNKPSLVWLIDAEGEGDTWLVGSFEFNQLNKLRYVTKYNRITRSIPRRWPDEQRNEVEHHIVSRAPSGESRLSGSFFANDDLYDTNNRLSLGDSKPAVQSSFRRPPPRAHSPDDYDTPHNMKSSGLPTFSHLRVADDGQSRMVKLTPPPAPIERRAVFAPNVSPSKSETVGHYPYYLPPKPLPATYSPTVHLSPRVSCDAPAVEGAALARYLPVVAPDGATILSPARSPASKKKLAVGCDEDAPAYPLFHA